MAKETAISTVTEFFDAEHVGKFEEAKWQLRVEGFQGIKDQIEQLKPPERVVEALARFVKAKTKDWKESNVNIIKESIFLL